MNALETILKTARPMIDADGNPVPHNMIVNKVLGRDAVNALIFIAESSGNCGYRDTGKHTYRNFSHGYISYSIKLEISRNPRREIQITACDNNPMYHLTASDLWDGALIVETSVQPTAVVKTAKRTIKAGSSKMQIIGGKLAGWHKFTTDAEFTVEYKNMRTVYVVKSGPDKGTYATSL